MANTLEHIRTPEARASGVEPRKISVILQNQTSNSNGFVSITPRRAEFFTMPSQNYNLSGNLDLLHLLATHEYRHIVQFQHANRGFNKAFYYLFGANALATLSYSGTPMVLGRAMRWQPKRPLPQVEEAAFLILIYCFELT